jgi:hypothetical protein
MASRSRAKAKQKAEAGEIPTATALPATRSIEPTARQRGRIALAGGVACLVAALVWIWLLPPATPLELWQIGLIGLLGIAGAAGLAAGGLHLDRRAATAVRHDRRRWIYGVLSLVCGIAYALGVLIVIPNRLPSAELHLLSIPIFTLMMAVGTLAGQRLGWWVAIVGGSLVLLSTIAIIIRILASAAFLAGVYGAFGKGAAMFALTSVAIIVEVVGLLPICQVKFLMSRAGRRAYGV